MNGYYNLKKINNIRATMQIEYHGNKKYTKIKKQQHRSYNISCEMSIKSKI